MADSLILCANSRKIVRNESQFNNISSMLLFHFHWYVGNAAHLLSHLLQFASVIEFSASKQTVCLRSGHSGASKVTELWNGK
jgi:hypothetical protein